MGEPESFRNKLEPKTELVCTSGALVPGGDAAGKGDTGTQMCKVQAQRSTPQPRSPQQYRTPTSQCCPQAGDKSPTSPGPQGQHPQASVHTDPLPQESYWSADPDATILGRVLGNPMQPWMRTHSCQGALLGQWPERRPHHSPPSRRRRSTDLPPQPHKTDY